MTEEINRAALIMFLSTTSSARFPSSNHAVRTIGRFKLLHCFIIYKKYVGVARLEGFAESFEKSARQSLLDRGGKRLFSTAARGGKSYSQPGRESLLHNNLLEATRRGTAKT